MATETSDAPTAAESTDDAERPTFRGCVFCYTAEWVAHGVKRLRR